MDQTNQHNLPSLKQFTNFHLPRTAIPILVSLSLFSFLFSFSSYIPFLLSTFSMEVLLSYSTDIKYIFLLCNGILAFLITESGAIGKSPLPHVFKENRIFEFRRTELELSSRNLVITEVANEVEEKKEDAVEEKKEVVEEKVVEEDGILVTVNKEDEDEDEDEEEEQESKFDDALEEEDEEEEEYEDEEGGIGFVSLEELNKKCDDFIKMMNGGIKIKAQKLGIFSGSELNYTM